MDILKHDKCERKNIEIMQGQQNQEAVIKINYYN